MSRPNRKGLTGRYFLSSVVLVVLAGACIVLVFGFGTHFLGLFSQKSKPRSSSASSSSTTDLPKHTSEEGFVSAAACRECHADQYKSWHKTYHRTMTQAATPDAVVPARDDVALESRNRSYRLFRRGDEFWVDTIDPAAEMIAFLQQRELGDLSDPPRVERRIAMTTGSHKHQTYWMQNPNGMLIQFPWVYHINTKRWVFRIDSFLRPPRDKVTFNIWNLHCIGCHATGASRASIPTHIPCTAPANSASRARPVTGRDAIT